MKLVIDISEQAYELFKGHTGMAFAFELDYDRAAEVEWAIKNGKLLQDVLKEETKGEKKQKKRDWRFVRLEKTLCPKILIPVGLKDLERGKQ